MIRPDKKALDSLRPLSSNEPSFILRTRSHGIWALQVLSSDVVCLRYTMLSLHHSKRWLFAISVRSFAPFLIESPWANLMMRMAIRRCPSGWLSGWQSPKVRTPASFVPRISGGFAGRRNDKSRCQVAHDPCLNLYFLSQSSSMISCLASVRR